MRITNSVALDYSENAVVSLESANSLVEAGNFDLAAAIYRAIVDEFPAAPYAHAKLGYCLSKLGDFQGALRHFDFAIQKKPDAPTTIWQRALVNEHLGRLDAAYDDYCMYSSLRPLDADCHLYMGMIREFQGRLGDAQICFGKAIELKPDHNEATNRLLKLGKTGEKF